MRARLGEEPPFPFPPRALVSSPAPAPAAAAAPENATPSTAYTSDAVFTLFGSFGSGFARTSALYSRFATSR